MKRIEARSFGRIEQVTVLGTDKSLGRFACPIMPDGIVCPLCSRLLWTNMKKAPLAGRRCKTKGCCVIDRVVSLDYHVTELER